TTPNASRSVTPCGVSKRASISPAGPATMTRSLSGSAAVIALARLLDREQLHIEHQRGVRWDDAAGARSAVRELRRNDEPALPAALHARDALIPAGNHAACAERKRKRLIAIARAVELRSLVLGRAVRPEPAGVVNDGGLSSLDLGAGALLDVGHVELLRRGR